MPRCYIVDSARFHYFVIPARLFQTTGRLFFQDRAELVVALLGVLALGGEQIKNSIVVLSKIRTEVDRGTPHFQAILDGCVSKVRPVLMVALTTVLGSIPLLKDPFFGALAVCIMFGLAFAAFLCLIVTPVLYSIFFDVREQSTAPAVAGTKTSLE